GLTRLVVGVPPGPEDQHRLERQPDPVERAGAVRRTGERHVVDGDVDVRGKHRDEQQDDAPRREPPRRRDEDRDAEDDLGEARDVDQRQMRRQVGRHHRNVEARVPEVVRPGDDVEDAHHPEEDALAVRHVASDAFLSAPQRTTAIATSTVTTAIMKSTYMTLLVTPPPNSSPRPPRSGPITDAISFPHAVTTSDQKSTPCARGPRRRWPPAAAIATSKSPLRIPSRWAMRQPRTSPGPTGVPRTTRANGNPAIMPTTKTTAPFATSNARWRSVMRRVGVRALRAAPVERRGRRPRRRIE